MKRVMIPGAGPGGGQNRRLRWIFYSTKITRTGGDHMTPNHMNRSVPESQQRRWLESCYNPSLTRWSIFKTTHGILFYTLSHFFLFSSHLFCPNPQRISPHGGDQMGRSQSFSSFRCVAARAHSCNLLDNGTPTTSGLSGPVVGPPKKRKLLHL